MTLEMCSVLGDLIEFTSGLKRVFPTIWRTNYPQVFDPILASNYLSLVWLFLPLLIIALFLIRDDDGPDMFLGPHEMHKILHGDRVPKPAAT